MFTYILSFYLLTCLYAHFYAYILPKLNNEPTLFDYFKSYYKDEIKQNKRTSDLVNGYFFTNFIPVLNIVLLISFLILDLKKAYRQVLFYLMVMTIKRHLRRTILSALKEGNIDLTEQDRKNIRQAFDNM